MKTFTVVNGALALDGQRLTPAALQELCDSLNAQQQALSELAVELAQFNRPLPFSFQTGDSNHEQR